MIKRIGFACKFTELGPKGPEAVAELNNRSTTVAWLNRQSRDIAEQRLYDIMLHNIGALRGLVQRVGSLDHGLRMVRIGSDVLPVYTEPTWGYYWRASSIRALCEREFNSIGQLARDLDVRLSMHPGQFTVLASDRPDVVDRSIEEFEYHADIARWLGYGKTFQDFKINVHIAGKAGPAGIRAAYGRLSPEARNTITIENDENSWGLDACLELVDTCPIVLDIHHHLIRDHEYIKASDDRVKQVIESWRGVRPTFHYSMSREDYLINHDTNTLPIMSLLLENGYKKNKLRAHSDYMWNYAVNTWAYDHFKWGDCMVESKSKNLATQKLFKFWKSLEDHM